MIGFLISLESIYLYIYLYAFFNNNENQKKKYRVYENIYDVNSNTLTKK